MKTAIKRTKKKTGVSSEQKVRSGRPLTARAVAELCGVELKTVHNWAVDGRLAHFRTPGRHLRFQPDVVETFLRECGYETNEARLRVVCVAARPNARFRKAMSGVDCIWVRDVWSALLEIGRTAPDIWVLDASQGGLPGLSSAVKAVKQKLPTVQVVVMRERASANEAPGLRYVDFDELTRLLLP